MTNKSLSDRVRQLIAENEQRQAADILSDAFRDQNASLFNLALIQQGNCKKLADQSAAGILSTDEINREQAKINAALLHLADEHARLFETGKSAVSQAPKRLWYAVALAALALTVWLIARVVENTGYPETFNLEIRLHQPGGEQAAITEGQVNLRLGDAVPQEKHTLDGSGTAVFKDLSSGKFRGDSVYLLYFPAQNRKFTIVDQSAAKTTGKDQTIRFTLEFIPDTTLVEMTLFDAKGQRIPGAQITIDGTLRCTSDEHGYFRAAIPKASGAIADFVIEKNGKRLFKQELAISPGPKSIPIE